MRRIGGLINKVCSIDNINIADDNARKAKRRSKKYIELHDQNRQQENEKLAESFKSLTYKTSKYHTFKIYEPKERIIYRLPYYPDRIAHHALMNVLHPIWNNRFIKNTFSCIKGRGIHKCAMTLYRDLRKTRFTDETKYCLKLDVTKFYPSIDHAILKKIISRKIKDKYVLALLYEIIDSIDGGKSVPIGNYLSQYFANVYLGYFDNWCKQELKCTYYYRYADDIVILSDSKQKLRNIMCAIKIYLKYMLKLSVKPNYQIFPIDQRKLDFVGYIYTHDHIAIRKTIKQRCKRLVHNFIYNRVSINKLLRTLPSYLGWFVHCNAKHLTTTLLNSINYVIECNKDIQHRDAEQFCKIRRRFLLL